MRTTDDGLDKKVGSLVLIYLGLLSKKQVAS